LKIDEPDTGNPRRMQSLIRSLRSCLSPSPLSIRRLNKGVSRPVFTHRPLPKQRPTDARRRLVSGLAQTLKSVLSQVRSCDRTEGCPLCTRVFETPGAVTPTALLDRPTTARAGPGMHRCCRPHTLAVDPTVHLPRRPFPRGSTPWIPTGRAPRTPPFGEGGRVERQRRY
jgi:hypothetical protein